MNIHVGDRVQYRQGGKPDLSGAYEITGIVLDYIPKNTSGYAITRKHFPGIQIKGHTANESAVNRFLIKPDLLPALHPVNKARQFCTQRIEKCRKA